MSTALEQIEECKGEPDLGDDEDVVKLSEPRAAVAPAEAPLLRRWHVCHASGHRETHELIGADRLLVPRQLEHALGGAYRLLLARCNGSRRMLVPWDQSGANPAVPVHPIASRLYAGLFVDPSVTAAAPGSIYGHVVVECHESLLAPEAVLLAHNFKAAPLPQLLQPKPLVFHA